MIEFLGSLKADLLDRRLLPLVLLVVAALVGAVAYVVLAGGSEASTPTATLSTAPAPNPSAGLAISRTTPETAVAEVTSGSATQHHGESHDPFVPLPSSEKPTTGASTTSTTPSTGSTSTSTPSGASESSSPSSSSPSTPSSESTPSKPSKPSKHQTVYHVAVLFGEVQPPGSATSTPLTPYVNLKLLTPLPSATQPLVVFRGVTAGGKSATFTLVGEAILHGAGTCLPSESQCEAIDLKPGKSEIFEVLTSGDQTVTYELTLVTITSTKASGASAAKVLRGESKAGRALLSHDGLVAIPYLRQSSQAGVLVFAK